VAVQFATSRYVPAACWLCVTVVSVFGILATDNLSTAVGVPLEASTVVFAALLAVVFTSRYRSERTLSPRPTSSAARRTDRGGRNTGWVAADGRRRRGRRRGLRTAQGSTGADTTSVVVAAQPLSDLPTFRVSTQDMLDLLKSGDQTGATRRVEDLEREWDNAQAPLTPRSDAAWTDIDGRIDPVLRELRATRPGPVPSSTTNAPTALLSALG
jgi:hypothetical protein